VGRDYWHSVYRTIRDYATDKSLGLNAIGNFWDKNPELNLVAGTSFYTAGDPNTGYEGLINNPAKAWVSRVQQYQYAIAQAENYIISATQMLSLVNFREAGSILGGMKTSFLRAIASELNGYPINTTWRTENRSRGTILIKGYNDRGPEVVIPMWLGIDDNAVDSLPPHADDISHAKFMELGAITRRAPIDDELTFFSPYIRAWKTDGSGDIDKMAHHSLFPYSAHHSVRGNKGYLANAVISPLLKLIDFIHDNFGYLRHNQKERWFLQNELNLFDDSFSFDEVMKFGFNPTFVDKDSFEETVLNKYTQPVPYPQPTPYDPLSLWVMNKDAETQTNVTTDTGTVTQTDINTPISMSLLYPIPNAGDTPEAAAYKLCAHNFDMDTEEYLRNNIAAMTATIVDKDFSAFALPYYYMKHWLPELPFAGIKTNPAEYSDSGKLADDFFFNVHPGLGARSRRNDEFFIDNGSAPSAISKIGTETSGTHRAAAGHRAIATRLKLLGADEVDVYISDPKDMQPGDLSGMFAHPSALDMGILQPCYSVTPAVVPTDLFQQGYNTLVTEYDPANHSTIVPETMKDFIAHYLTKEVELHDGASYYRRDTGAIVVEDLTKMPVINGSDTAGPFFNALNYGDGGVHPVADARMGYLKCWPVFTGMFGNDRPSIAFSRSDLILPVAFAEGAAVSDDSADLFVLGLVPVPIAHVQPSAINHHAPDADVNNLSASIFGGGLLTDAFTDGGEGLVAGYLYDATQDTGTTGRLDVLNDKVGIPYTYFNVLRPFKAAYRYIADTFSKLVLNEKQVMSAEDAKSVLSEGALGLQGSTISNPGIIDPSYAQFSKGDRVNKRDNKRRSSSRDSYSKKKRKPRNKFKAKSSNDVKFKPIDDTPEKLSNKTFIDDSKPAVESDSSSEEVKS
jgi:hypothetical protein